METEKRINNQIVGNAGLFYVCYQLSKRGWNCLPTSRNAKGVDLVIYSQDAKKNHTIQIKSLREKNPVPFGANPCLIAEFLIIVIKVLSKKPEIYIMKTEDIKQRLHKGEKDGKYSYWLRPKNYEKFKEKWKYIGGGRVDE